MGWIHDGGNSSLGKRELYEKDKTALTPINLMKAEPEEEWKRR